jgi:hypothetical protein
MALFHLLNIYWGGLCHDFSHYASIAIWMLCIYWPFSLALTVLEAVELMDDMELEIGHFFSAESTWLVYVHMLWSFILYFFYPRHFKGILFCRKRTRGGHFLKSVTTSGIVFIFISIFPMYWYIMKSKSCISLAPFPMITRPVMHHFFLERFLLPADWFQSRLAYTRSVAASSMVIYFSHSKCNWSLWMGSKLTTLAYCVLNWTLFFSFSGRIHRGTRGSPFHEYPHWSRHRGGCTHRSWCCIRTGSHA